MHLLHLKLILAGSANASTSQQKGQQVVTHHVMHKSIDDLIRLFWETEDGPTGKMSLTPEEKFVVEHFQSNHSRDEDGRFIVPLPRKSDSPTLGESRSQAVKRFITLERSILYKGRIQ